MLIYYLVGLFLCRTSSQSYLQGYDDSILYNINWLEAVPDSPSTENAKPDDPNIVSYEEIVVQTEAKEKYICKIPNVVDNEKDTNEKYSGPSPFELLYELFTQMPCVHKLDPYWTYELCHGRHIRQYHEEREGKTVKLQEFFLGRLEKTDLEAKRALWNDEDITRAVNHIPAKKIDGLNMPYFQVNMTDGTLCDLNGKARVTKVLYVCYALGKHEIYSLKETSICEYEIIVLSPLLCSHPKYRPQTSGENAINCTPLDGAGKVPKSLLQMEAESFRLQHQSFGFDDDFLEDLMTVLNLKPTGANQNMPRVRLELLPLGDNAVDSLGVHNYPQISIQQPTDQGVTEAEFKGFLDGSECIQGGSGWWKYEFCFGKSVTQFHNEKDGSKTVVNLGNFIKSGHLKWLKANPHKRPLVGSHLSYLYTMGSKCEETGTFRQTEVKLKCVENKNSPGAVSLYLLEPRTCQYILGVESRLVCRLLEKVDQDGLLVADADDQIGFTKSEYATGYSSPAKSSSPQKEGNRKKDVKITVVIEDEGNGIADGDE